MYYVRIIIAEYLEQKKWRHSSETSEISWMRKLPYKAKMKWNLFHSDGGCSTRVLPLGSGFTYISVLTSVQGSNSTWLAFQRVDALPQLPIVLLLQEIADALIIRLASSAFFWCKRRRKKTSWSLGNLWWVAPNQPVGLNGLLPLKRHLYCNGDANPRLRGLMLRAAPAHV